MASARMVVVVDEACREWGEMGVVAPTLEAALMVVVEALGAAEEAIPSHTSMVLYHQ